VKNKRPIAKRARHSAAAVVQPSRSQLRRDLEKATTRKLILETARTMFAGEGYDRTTMRGIADQIGYTATAIYHHFVDKDALMLELCANDFRELGAALTSIGGIADPIERIRQMGRNYVRFAVEHPEQFRFMFLIDRPMPGPDDMKHLDPGEDGYAFLRQAVVQAIDAGRFRPECNNPDLVAQMLWSAVHGVATIHVTSDGGKHKWLQLEDAQETTVALCNAVMRGLVREK
jgi:AcrR family transcriptional regulator